MQRPVIFPPADYAVFSDNKIVPEITNPSPFLSKQGSYIKSQQQLCSPTSQHLICKLTFTFILLFRVCRVHPNVRVCPAPVRAPGMHRTPIIICVQALHRTVESTCKGKGSISLSPFVHTRIILVP